jgi:hypothetical protein
MENNQENQINVDLSSVNLTELPGYSTLDDSAQEQLRQVESLASFDPAFRASKEYQDLVSGLQSVNSQAEEDEEYEDEDSQETYTQEETQRIEEILDLAESDEEYRNTKEFQELLKELEDNGYFEDEEEEEIDDIFGVTKTSKKDKKININFEAPREMIQLISSKFGVKDPSTFFSSAETWRNQAQEGVQVKEEHERLKTDLQAMPFELKQAIQFWANGEDFTQVFSNNERLEFSEDFNKQEPENLVQHYFSEQYNELVKKYNDDKISEEDFDDRINLLASSTKRMFADDKQALEKQREDFATNQKQEYEAFRRSALLSVENLGKTYPDFSKSEISKIRNILVEGKVDNLFMNADGSYSDSAAEMVAYAMYGKKMLESVKAVAQRRGESEANQMIVDKSPKTLRRLKSSGPTQGAGTKETAHLSGLFKNDPYA